jgi:cytochrome P450
MAPASSIISELRQKTASEQAALFAVAVSFAVLVRVITLIVFGNLRTIPGPFLSRLTGLPVSLAAFKGRRAQWLYELHKKYGPVVRVAPGEVSIADPAHYRTIYSNPKTSHKDPSFYGAATFTGPDNIFQMVNREQHAARRKLVAAPYSLQSMHKLEHIIRDKSRLLADRFLSDAAASKRGTVDAYELCALFSFELVCAAGFAKDFGSRSSALSVLKAMETSGPRLIFNAIFPPLKDASWNTKVPGRIGAVYRAHNYWHECSRQMVREYLDRKDSEDIQDFLLAPFRDGVDGWLGRQLSEAEFVEEAMGIMLAGSGTTSSTLTYFLYVISLPRNQHVQERLREEVMRVSDTNNLAELREAPYLNAVIKETMRLYPTIISTLPRIVDQPIYIDGTELPPGVVVGMQNYVHHRDPVVFPDPESFIPERWLESPELEAMETALSKSPPV